MSGDGVIITHDEALRLIDDRIGERAYLGFLVARGGSEWEDDGPVQFIHTIGRLENPLAPRPPRLDPEVGWYRFGKSGQMVPVAPMVGTIRRRDYGIDFLIADSVSIRIAWQGSREVGDGPDAGHLARLRILGLAREDETASGDSSLDLRQFLAEASRAKAEVVAASPTAFSFEDEAGSRRRVWDLGVRVLPDQEAAFEASVEVAWLVSERIEERLQRGESLTASPAETVVLEIAYDASNRDQVMALSVDGGFGPRGFKISGMIAGRIVVPANGDEPMQEGRAELEE